MALSAVQLCHRVVDGLCGREPPHRGDYSASWSSDEWRELLDSLAALFRRAVGADSSDEEVRGSSGARCSLEVASGMKKTNSLICFYIIIIMYNNSSFMQQRFLLCGQRTKRNIRTQ